MGLPFRSAPVLTTCPECQTTFRVDQPQLEARRGLVRCGRCNAVFNAYDSLEHELATPPTSLEAGNSNEPASYGSELGLGLNSTEDGEPAAHAAAAAENADLAGGEFTVESAQDAAMPAKTSSTDESPPGWLSNLKEDGVRLGNEVPPSEAPQEYPRQADSDDILLTELPTRRMAKSSGTTGKAVFYAVAAVLLFMLLALQTVYFLRGAIVSQVPELRPGFAALCRELGCQIPLSAKLDAIRVEASSLETDPEQASHARLRVTFSNRARYAQAWPHFKLKLTDVQNVAMAQRVFKPEDYLPKERDPENGMGPMSELEFQLDLDLGTLSAAGYEVKPIYP